jgi:c-di-AMP phosphodiesterase-like protein
MIIMMMIIIIIIIIIIIMMIIITIIIIIIIMMMIIIIIIITGSMEPQLKTESTGRPGQRSMAARQERPSREEVPTKTPSKI